MLTENQIRSLTTSQTYSRGQDYYHAGAVGDLMRRGDTLTAEVEGNYGSAYQVTIELGDADDIDATCTCPYARKYKVGDAVREVVGLTSINGTHVCRKHK